MKDIAEMRPEKYSKTIEETIAVEAMKSYFQNLGLKRAQRKVDVLIADSIKKVEKIDSILVTRS